MPSDTPKPTVNPSGGLPPFVVLTGNPNCGKTTLFNALTGLRAKVGNYAGVTVERKEGRLQGSAREVTVLDLPGTYSLSPQSLDERVARDVLFHRLPEVPPPALVVVVVDASNLQRNLYFATQVIELGYPTLIALNMVDVARANGQQIDAGALSKALGVPVVPVVASHGEGLDLLRKQIEAELSSPAPRAAPRQFCELPEIFGHEADLLAQSLIRHAPDNRYHALAEAVLVLCEDLGVSQEASPYPGWLLSQVRTARRKLESQGVDWRSVPIEARYARVMAIEQMVTTSSDTAGVPMTDRIDAVLTHRIWGPVFFVVIMTLMFQSIFTLAPYPAEALQFLVDSAGNWVVGHLPQGPVSELIHLGLFKGAGAVVVFLPQICLLFFFIGLLEDTGYMSRAAFLMDRLMSQVGLHGKSFIPMLSSFGCAIPGILATRTIETTKDRLVTILVAPLMSCSARLPVYTLLIAACIPDESVLGVVRLPALVLLSMYLLGIAAALGMAWLFKKTLLKGPTPMLILELPPYKCPVFLTVARNMWDRSKMFLRRAGTVILGINVLLWFLASYPKDAEAARRFESTRAAVAAAPEATPEEVAKKQAAMEVLDREQAGHVLRHSFAGKLGHLIEPLIEPLGFDWKIGIGIVSSFAAREVFVSTMSMVYNVGEPGEDDEAVKGLAATLQSQRTADGRIQYRPRVALSLMVFYVFALQCVSTVAVVRRETQSWAWPAFQWFYMGALAWIMTFLTYHLAPLFGLQ